MQDVKEFHGYLALPRHSLLLYQELGYDLYGFYLGLVMNAEWRRGSANFGKVIKSQAELAKSLQLTQSTVSRNFKRLDKHRFFAVRYRNTILLKFFPLFLIDVAKHIHSNDYANLHELYADLYKINRQLQDNYADSQDKRTANRLLRLNVSSNGYYSSPSPNNEYEIDNEEVDKGIEEMKNKQNQQ